VPQIFVDKLEEDIKEIYKRFKFKKDMIFTKTDRKKYAEATTCHICEKELGNDRVRDHCHLTGKFRGAAHESCNLNYKLPIFYPILFHNLSGYDCHLFIKQLAGKNGEKINCIPKTEEDYISFSKEIIVITYLDANNLYGWAMSQKLPTHGFKWMGDKKLENWRDISCILEVDLIYPEELHDLHNDYPLAPESITLEGSQVPKLIPNLNHKWNYVVYYANLKMYESLGMKISKIHRGIRFEEVSGSKSTLT